MRRQTLTAALALVAVTAVWGATFPLVKAALADAPPLVFNLLRMALAAAVLAAVHAPQLRAVGPVQLRDGAVAGTLLALGYEFQTAGLAHTTPTRSAFLTGLVVVFVPLLAVVPRLARTRRALTLPALLAVLLAFSGVVLLTRPAGSHEPVLGGMHTGEWLTLACALAYALHVLALDRAAGRTQPRTLAALQVGCCAVVMLLLLPLGGPLRAQFAATHPTARLLTALAVTALLATAAAFTVQSWAQHHLPPTTTALLLSLEPVFALLTAAVWLGERLRPATLAGAGLILAAILLAELKPLSAELKPLRRAKPQPLPLHAESADTL